MTSANTSPDKALAKFDLRMRSLDHEAGQPFNMCCYDDCTRIAVWSLWLHTPEWGATYVRCHFHATHDMAAAASEASEKYSSRLS